MGFLERRTRSQCLLVSQQAGMARRERSRDSVCLSPLTSEPGSGRLCGLRIGEQHVDKLAQRTAGVATSKRTEPRARASCAEDGASGWCWCEGRTERFGLRYQDRFGSPNSNKSASDERGHHTQRRLRARGDASFVAGVILRNRLDSARGPDAQASVTLRRRSRRFGVVLVESLILAQDQRWRRA